MHRHTGSPYHGRPGNVLSEHAQGIPARAEPGDDRRRAQRRQFRRWTWIDRRTGFDRRRGAYRSPVAATLNAWLVSLRDTPAALATVLVLANVLNLADLLFTLFALDLGAVEGNPLMRWLLEQSVAAAATVKIGLVSGISVVVWRLREYRMILAVALVAVATFGGVVIYDLWAIYRR